MKQYVDIKLEIRELHEKIAKLETQIEKVANGGEVVDMVKGGYGGIQNFKIEGFPSAEYSRKRTLLMLRKERLDKLEIELLETINQVEEYISGIEDSHIRRIVNLRVVEGLPWLTIAKRIGGQNTEDSVKKAYYRYIDKTL